MHIVHLDDSGLLRKAISNQLLLSYPGSVIKGFSNNPQAWAYVTECMQNKIAVDLIITDFEHMAGDGLEFACIIRQKEKEYNIHVPIMMFTHKEMNKEIHQALLTRTIDKYFNKVDDMPDILKYINKLNK